LCDQCHGTSGTASLVDIEEHTEAVMGVGTYGFWPFDPKCVDCHDPHGDSNIQMIKDYINVATSNLSVGGGSYGNNYSTTDITSGNSQQLPVTFTNNAIGQGAGGFATTAPAGEGICEVCHQQNATGSNWYNRGAAGANGHPTDPCTDCHAHATDGFKGAGCFGCHSGVEASTKPQPNAGVANPVDETEYYTTGHGLDTGSTYPMTGNPGAGLITAGVHPGCYTCHDPNADHNPALGTDPYRLGVYAADTNAMVWLQALLPVS
jgi:hypothetical protein